MPLAGSLTRVCVDPNTRNYARKLIRSIRCLSSRSPFDFMPYRFIGVVARERERRVHRRVSASVSIQYSGRECSGQVGERIGRFVSGRERIFEVGQSGRRICGKVSRSWLWRRVALRRGHSKKGYSMMMMTMAFYCGNFFAREFRILCF